MHSFFFRELQLITVLLLIWSFYTSWSTWLISLKLCVVVHFWLRLIFTKVFILDQQKPQTLWPFQQNFITPFKEKVIEKRQTVLLPDLWLLSSIKKFENSMIPAWTEAPPKMTWRRTFQTKKIEVWSKSLFLISNF